MFCTKCGKEIDYEADVCNECAAETPVAETPVEEAPVVETVVATEVVAEAEATEEAAPEVFDKMYNFKPALVNTIVSYLAGTFSSIMAMPLLTAFYTSFISNQGRGFFLPLYAIILAAVGGLAFGIVSLVFLIKSVPVLKDTIAYKNKHGKTPVAPFILSIVSVVLSATALFSCVTYLFVGVGSVILMLGEALISLA